MDLLERYLQAIGQYLPEATREDTLAELRANLLEQMDARAEEFGRPLDDVDIAAILRAHGKPELVALRYLPQQSLIGPTVFPFYLFTLKRMLPLVLFVYAIAQGSVLIFAEGGRHLAGGILHALLQLPLTLLISWASVTLVFAIIDFSHGRFNVQKSAWDPAKLPAVKTDAVDYSPKSVAKRALDLCFHALWMAYVLWVPRHPFWIMGPGVFVFEGMGVTLAPVWHIFYVLLIILLCVQLVMKLVALGSGVHAWMKPMKWATDLLGVVALGIIACAKELLVPANANADLHTLATVNHAMSMGFRIALFFAIVGLVKEGWQLTKRKMPLGQFAF